MSVLGIGVSSNGLARISPMVGWPTMPLFSFMFIIIIYLSHVLPIKQIFALGLAFPSFAAMIQCFNSKLYCNFHPNRQMPVSKISKMTCHYLNDGITYPWDHPSLVAELEMPFFFLNYSARQGLLVTAATLSQKKKGVSVRERGCCAAA